MLLRSYCPSQCPLIALRLCHHALVPAAPLPGITSPSLSPATELPKPTREQLWFKTSTGLRCYSLQHVPLITTKLNALGKKSVTGHVINPLHKDTPQQNDKSSVLCQTLKDSLFAVANQRVPWSLARFHGFSPSVAVPSHPSVMEFPVLCKHRAITRGGLSSISV